jgi:hypothetical protein
MKKHLFTCKPTPDGESCDCPEALPTADFRQRLLDLARRYNAPGTDEEIMRMSITDLAYVIAAHERFDAGAEGFTDEVMSKVEPPPKNDIADLAFAIARLEDAAQNAEDREQMGRASKIRAEVRGLNAQLKALVAAADQAVAS